MAIVELSDVSKGHCQLQVDDTSELGRSKLQKLIAPVTAIIGDLGNPIDQAKFKSAAIGGTFATPAIDLGESRTLIIKAGGNAAVRVYKEADGSLFGDSPYADAIAIGKGDVWMSFELDAAVGATAGVLMPSGFGVYVSAVTGCIFTSYTRFSGPAALPDGKECLGQTLSNFKLLKSAQDVRHQKIGTVQVCDISGTIKFTGSYMVPMSVNGLSLASVSAPSSSPFNYSVTVEPDFDLGLQGTIAVSGDYIIRCYRVSEGEARFGVYKKKQTDFSVAFEASAGIEAERGTSDLFTKFFKHVAPKVDPKQAGLTEQDCGVIQQALTASVNRSLTIALNVSCTASFAHEAAFIYKIDLTQNAADTDAALNAAFKGDWTLLQKLSTAQELRNVTGETKERNHVANVNLLGVFNYASMSDFVGSCTVLHSPEDGTITVTDKQTASRISIASVPYVAAADRLRAVLNEASIATMTYTAATAGGKLGADLKVTQNLLLYKEKLDAKSVHKNMLPAVALRLITASEWQNLVPHQPAASHVRIAAQAVFDGDAAIQLFFSDVAAQTPRNLADVKRLGRAVLSALLDRDNTVDLKRWQILNSDDAWSQMEQQQFPKDSPASYSDWYDITFWADAICKVAVPLKAVLQSVGNVGPGEDPTQNADFMSKRADLAKAIGAVTRNSHAAFEPGWPIAVMVSLSGFKASTRFEAAWDGQTFLDKKPSPLIAANA
ncbi:MAG: hypothetical protein JO091_06645 [Acidobacteriaceae bacterium]|nr:hypothetical protein [Acidobacteriaceae bacterium]